jgi:VIT1/CCC1 family predicted Fe2+/Mn2+ transporter
VSGGHGRAGVLDPATRLGEVLFGLIMVVSITGSLHVASAGREEVRTMLYAALGCNLAWGIVDAAMYVMNDVLERNRANADLRRLQAAKSDAEADAILVSRLSDDFAAAVKPGDLDAIRARLRAHPPPPERVGIAGRNLTEALAVLLLVFCSTFPAAAPFLLFDEPLLALRVSHGVVLVMMFAAGSVAARYAGLPPLRTGLLVAALGVVLVVLTILLGG